MVARVASGFVGRLNHIYIFVSLAPQTGRPAFPPVVGRGWGAHCWSCLSVLRAPATKGSTSQMSGAAISCTFGIHFPGQRNVTEHSGAGAGKFSKHAFRGYVATVASFSQGSSTRTFPTTSILWASRLKSEILWKAVSFFWGGCVHHLR